MTLRRLVFAVVLALALWSLVTPAPALEKLKVGVAASVENEVEGVLENSIEKLGEGSEVFFKQLVRTGEASKANLKFLDDTNLDVWPKTEIRLDSFIYQPGKKSGSVVLNVPLGYVRFATGALSPKSYTINTPLGFIGIRGTEFHLVVRSDRLTARLLRGEIRITALDRRVFWLRTPNAAITIHRDGRVNGPRNWSGDVLEFAALPGPAPRAASIPRATGRHTIVNSDTKLILRTDAAPFRVLVEGPHEVAK